MLTSQDCPTPPPGAPVPPSPETAQAGVASRILFDARRGRFVFERGPERLDVLVIPPGLARVEEPRPEPKEAA